MTISLKNILVSFILIIAIALSCWSIYLANQSQILVTQDSRDRPDAFMENVVATIMNKQGKPKLKVETERMTHYQNNDTTEFTTPHVVVFRQSPEPWHINAAHGKAQQGIDEIAFWDNVIIHHLADHDNPVTTMRTAALTIFPSKQVAKTSEAIVVTQPNSTIHAIGMLANWDEGTVKLLSNAREEYVPNS